MASYRIVCVEENSHIRPWVPVMIRIRPERWTVAQVRERIEAGDRFYTEDADGNRADVEPYGDEWIRTDADAETDNNLDDLRACHSFVAK